MFQIDSGTIFMVSAAIGLLAWRKAQDLGGEAHKFQQVLMRGMFAFECALASFRCAIFAAWSNGLDLKLDEKALESMPDAWWTGPASILMALGIYAALWHFTPKKSASKPSK
jgi:hypothetical protein